MILRWLRRAAAPKALSIVSPGDDRPQAQGTNDPDARQVEQLYEASRYVEATEMTQVALAAKALNNLAMLYFEQGRDADAEPLFKCALAILNMALGPDQKTIEFASTSPRLQCTDQRNPA
jgi:Tetratricopeptide repeat